MKNKTLIGTLAGGIVFFLLGWLIYGIALQQYMEDNTSGNRAMEDMVWWAMLLSNFVWAYLIALVFEWSNTNGFVLGMQRGLLLGLICALANGMSFYASTTYYDSFMVVLMDAIAISIMTTIVGGIIGMLRSKREMKS